MAAPSRTYRVAHLDTGHNNSLNVLTSTQTAAQHAAAAGIDQATAVKRLSLLVDEALVVAVKNSHGAPLGTYQAA